MNKLQRSTAVVKFGSELVSDRRGVREDAIRGYAEGLVRQYEGRGLVVVTSGAIDAGLAIREQSGRQACMDSVYAGIGNTALMSAWQSAFAEAGRDAGSLLVTHHELDSEEGEEFVKTLDDYVHAGVTAVVNCNDALSNFELLQKRNAADNDGLAAHIAALGANELTLFTKKGGVVHKRGELIDAITRRNAENIRGMLVARTRGDERQHNGIVSKFDAAVRASKAGVAAVRIAAVNHDMSGERVTNFNI